MGGVGGDRGIVFFIVVGKVILIQFRVYVRNAWHTKVYLLRGLTKNRLLAFLCTMDRNIFGPRFA